MKGTDWSTKITPFLRKTQNQIQQFFLDQASGFVSGLNVGRQTSEGVELQINKGDFSKNGLSGSLAFTYTNSFIRYNTLQNGTTIVSGINNDIMNYNAFTKGCQNDAAAHGGTATPIPHAVRAAPLQHRASRPPARRTPVAQPAPSVTPIGMRRSRRRLAQLQTTRSMTCSQVRSGRQLRRSKLPIRPPWC